MVKYLSACTARSALALLLFTVSFGLGAQVLQRLPALALNPDAVTVSGLSSGGYMASQFAVAYSASVVGVAVIAGGPYGCSRGSVGTAMLNCSCPAQQPFALRLQEIWGGGCQVFNPDVYLAFSEAATRGNLGEIDDIENLHRQRLWLFSGGQDHVVERPLVQAVKAYYRRMGLDDARIKTEDRADAGHGLPSLTASQACSNTDTPFLTQCQFDAAGELLKWMYPQMASISASATEDGALKRFKQKRYGDGKVFNGLDASGWIYIPQACEQGLVQCALHVVFHGCEQGQSFVSKGKVFGTQFVKGAGYNTWAEAGNIVVLYPQIKASTQGNFYNPLGFNPKGCWDFWGYTEGFAALNSGAPNFAKRSAPQMRAVKAMIDDLLRMP